MAGPPAEPFDPMISELIRAKARKLCRCSPGFRRSDEEDVRQELSLQLLRALPKHDPARSALGTFATAVITNRVSSMANHARAQKRDRRRVRPLDDAAESSVPHLDPSDVVIDVGECIARMPKELGAAATLFIEHCDIAGVCRHTGLTRSRMRTLRHRIARHLRDAGLAPDSARPAATPRRDRVYDQRRHAA